MIRFRVHHKLYIGTVLLAQHFGRMCKNNHRLKAKQEQKKKKKYGTNIFNYFAARYLTIIVIT